ncbi:myosin phosphatase Rho-interacting protein-like isoform X2 [Megalops cyprinoides]|uniref:myosin phosphatase Rho-interacting protein-like isoform X2 n=1 Tax=Megalops cyprinoides TaxID=118141 RepID=UPI0018654596|nr:myosin phosphatase Rho-interacting protein-like isoform X2 [Megalops cyprinoides]
MSISRDNSCKKFQANIFNKNKCQNCFKPRELHLLTDEDLNQAKPIYGGWLCLAPEGTDFDNPMQRSRKWQRRFFVLYETGSLRFALDELPTTLPQGTVNMNLCMNVIDAEQKTGQKNALCIVLPDQEYYIRAESKEVITGWSEQLLVYQQTIELNMKKKRKVELSTSQEPRPTNIVEGIPEAEKVPDSRSSLWQEELRSRDPVSALPAADATPLGSPLPPTGEVTPDGLTSDLTDDKVNGVSLAAASQHPVGGSWSGVQGDGRGGIPHCPSPTPSDPFPSGLLPNGSHVSGLASSLDSEGHGDAKASRRTSRPRRRNAEKRGRARTPGIQEGAPCSVPEESRCSVADRRAAQEPGDKEGTVEAGGASNRRCRSEAHHSQREEQDGAQGSDRLTAPLQPLRRATSLDRRTTESVMTPDLLNFKKGWMVKLDHQKKWQKFWFVLTNHSLRYYKDSIAEEASDMEGEIDLTTCYNVTEYQVQRNYGFQIHTQESVHTLSAMTAGIRRNWIEALMKNARPSTATDVASPHGLPKPDVTQTFTAEAGSKRTRTRARRREGRAKTVDCAGFRAMPETQPPQGLAGEAGEEHRGVREYEAVPCSSLKPGRGTKQPWTVEEEIEQRWLQVERTASREESRVALSPVVSTEPPCGGSAELERQLQAYKREVEELRAQLKTHHQQQLDQSQQKTEVQLGSALKREPQVCSPLDSLSLEAESPERAASLPVLDLARKYQETVTLLQQQEERKRSMQAQLLSPSSPPETHGPVAKETEGIRVKELNILLRDSEGRPQGLKDLLLDGSPVSVGELVRLLGLHGDAESYLPGQEGMLGRTEELKSHATERPKEEQKLAQEVELLTSKNKTLQQRCQEMVNQLTEANREIERLKAPLTSQEARQQSPLMAEEMERLKAQLAEMDAEGRLHPKEATLKGKGLQAEEDCSKEALLRNWEWLYPQTEVTEAKLSEEQAQENKLHLAEGACSNLCAQIEELQGKSQECKRDQGGSSAESEVRIQQEELEGDRKSEGGYSAVYGGEEGTKQSSERCDPGADRIQQAAEAIRMKSEALGKLSEVIGKVEMNMERVMSELLSTAEKGTGSDLVQSEGEGVDQAMMRKFLLEGEFWGRLLNVLEAGPSQVQESEPANGFVRDLAEHMTVERKMLLLAQRLFPSPKVDLLNSRDIQSTGMKEDGSRTQGNLGIIEKHEIDTNVKTKHSVSDFCNLFDDSASGLIRKDLMETLQEKAFLLDQIAFAIQASASVELRALAQRLGDLQSQNGHWSAWVWGAALETHASYLISWLLLQSRVLRETEPVAQAAPMGCTSCAELRRQIEVLRTKVVHPGSPASGEGIPSTRVLMEGRSTAPLWGNEEQEEDMMSLRMKYEKDLEDLKAVCERGFAAMEESHQKAMEGLQQQHQRDLEQERRDRDRLLAEETAATIAAIEAMKNAHQLELERELEKACKANGGTEGADIEEIRRQHEEELVLLQQELQAVSEHYSQKCLESAHLASALEAERQALLQCQRENQELSAHNQDLNNRLAMEVTELRSMTCQDEGDTCGLIPGKEAYELEVMLRVKESEVQYLKQEVSSLKEELQTTQRDKKFATDKYKDTYTELSIVRAKAERDLALLRDQLQQAHDAMGKPFLEELEQSGYGIRPCYSLLALSPAQIDIMKSKSNPDFLKMATTAARSSDRILRSKSLKEGLTNEQRLHLFDNQETKQF